MSFDGLVMRAVVHDCNQRLTGSRIDKIYQPNRHEVVLQLRGPQGREKLLLSTLPQESRVHCTTSSTPNPASPPLFCMVLRKHLEGGRILSFQQQGLDRVMSIQVQVLNEMGDRVVRTLVAEIMGKHSNLILVDPDRNTIIDAIRRVPHSVSRVRQVLPGLLYEAPPNKAKLPLWEETAEGIAPRLLALGLSAPVDKSLLKTYDGLGPQSVQELLHRARIQPEQPMEYFGEIDYQQLFQTLSQVGKDLLEHRYQPEIGYLDHHPKTFSALALTHWPENQRKAFASIYEMLDTYYQNRGILQLFQQKQNHLASVIRKEQERCQKKAQLQAQAVEAAKEAQTWRLYGDLLLTHQHSLAQGESVTVANYFEPEAPLLTIPLDPMLSPLDNAKLFFKKYQKAQQTAGAAQVHYEETLQELLYLESLATGLESVQSLQELAEIREELAEAGYLKKEPVKGKKKPPQAKGVSLHQVRLDGFQILFGKNNRQNDYITMKLARSDDLWLHLQKIPSAHVIIRNPQRQEIPDQVLSLAAKLCLWHSKARHSNNVPVDYTLRQHVWKPKGSKPGMVLYKNQRTLYLSVQESEILPWLEGSADPQEGS